MFRIPFLLLLLLCGCSDQENRQNRQEEIVRWMYADKPRVLATTEIVKDLVSHIGGEQISVIALISGALDPHSYQLVKGDGELFDRADVVIANGLGLEHTPSLTAQFKKHPKVYFLGDRIAKDPTVSILHYSGVPDPHIWMDVGLWKKTIPVVAEALIQNDPTHAELYNQRAEAYAIELDVLDQEVRKQLQAIPDNQRYLVTSHDAFNYFARSYLATDSERENGEWQARFEAPEGLAPDSQLSTSDIQKILDHLQKHKIHTLFPESNVSKASILKIISSGKALGLDLHASPHPLYGDAMGERGSAGDSYPKMLRYNAMTISEQIRQGEVASAIPVND